MVSSVPSRFLIVLFICLATFSITTELQQLSFFLFNYFVIAFYNKSYKYFFTVKMHDVWPNYEISLFL